MDVIQTAKAAIKFPLKLTARFFGHHNRKHAEPQLLVLMYHRILPETDPRTRFEEPGMVVSPETFESNLQLLSSRFEFTTVSRWNDLKNQGKPLPQMACAITFDDGWADNFQYAYPVLKKYNIPATIFLVSEYMDTDKTFWPEIVMQLCIYIAENKPDLWMKDELSWLTENRHSYSFSSKVPDKNDLANIVSSCKQFTDKNIYQKLELFINKYCPDFQNTGQSLLNWNQIQQLEKSKLIEFGSHTCDHTRLNAYLSDDETKRQITVSKQQLDQKLQTPVRSFCFPNGDYTDTALSYVADNYSCAVTTQSGWNNSASDSYQLKRIGIHNDIAKTPTQFLAAISGWNI